MNKLMARFAWWLMGQAGTRRMFCANRYERGVEYKHAELKMVLRDKRQPDGYSWEEVYAVLRTAFHRDPTAEEWRWVTTRMQSDPERVVELGMGL
jgi:hypothetical protein